MSNCLTKATSWSLHRSEKEYFRSCIYPIDLKSSKRSISIRELFDDN